MGHEGFANTIGLAGQVAWYAVVDDNIPRLVQWDDGMLVYTLIQPVQG